MTTMFDATLALAIKLGVVRASTATGTTSTSVTPDTKRTEADDIFIGGTIWITAATSAAPEGEWAYVTDFANSGGVITHSVLTVQTASGDSYAIAGGRYPLDVLISAINNELIKYKAPRWDLTTLDVVSAQSEYELPDGIDQYNLIGVYETLKDDADDNRPTPLKFDVQSAAAGSKHTVIILSKQIGVDNDIWLEYLAPVTPLYLAADTIDEIIPLPRLLAHAAVNAELNRMRTYASESELDIRMLDRYERQAAEADLRYPVRLPGKRGKVNEAGGSLSHELRMTQPALP